jgi:hypothetical protein
VLQPCAREDVVLSVSDTLAAKGALSVLAVLGMSSLSIKELQTQQLNKLLLHILNSGTVASFEAVGEAVVKLAGCSGEQPAAETLQELRVFQTLVTDKAWGWMQERLRAPTESSQSILSHCIALLTAHTA